MKKDMKVRAEMNIVDKGNIMASGDVFLNEMFVIHNVRIMKKMKEDGEMDWFVSMPSRRRGEEWERVVTIRDPDLRKKIEDEVQASAEKALHKDLGDFSLSVDIRLYEVGDTRGYATIVFNDMVQIDNIPFLPFAAGSILFSLAYGAIACLLAYKLAPKTFRIRKD